MCIADGLARLGVRRLLLAIHDTSFPSDPDEDTGRGSPATRAAARLFAYAKSLGFTGIQLGPQGQTSRSNPSPYDSTIFGRNLGNIGIAALRAGGAFEGLVTIARVVDGSNAHDAVGTHDAVEAHDGGAHDVEAHDGGAHDVDSHDDVGAHDVEARHTVDSRDAAGSRDAGDASRAESTRARHRDAYETMHSLVDTAWRAHRAGARPDLAAPFAAFRTANARWLEREALYLAICETHDSHGFRSWPPSERDLWLGTASDIGEIKSGTRAIGETPATQADDRATNVAYARQRASVDVSRATAADDRATNVAYARQRATVDVSLATQADDRAGNVEHATIDALLAKHVDVVERHAFGQFLVHAEHRRVRDEATRVGLALYGDLQVGYADADAWAYAPVFRRDYLMGAPPSRTNPEGQPWGYPVLDPAQYQGAAKALVVARAEKAFAEYDSVRIDHPHGLICPWVYRAGDADPASAVRAGARLFESPDLDDHPALARFAIARADQIDRTQMRYADRWVRADDEHRLDDAQVDRYAALFDALVDSARANGRDANDLSCEVLSTMPTPLEAVLARYDLGRWRITQKANLDDEGDVYRAENARRQDWVMLGNHDTAPIFALLREWSSAKREQWARHLAQRLALAQPERLANDGFFASAMLAELFVSRAENVSIFFADLFGIEDRFNVPGLVDDANWSLRLPADFEAMYAERLARGAALDLALAVELALAAPR